MSAEHATDIIEIPQGEKRIKQRGSDEGWRAKVKLLCTQSLAKEIQMTQSPDTPRGSKVPREKRENRRGEMGTNTSFVGGGFKRNPQYDRLFKPMPLSFKKAPVSHPELEATCCLSPGVEKQTLHCHYVQLLMITKGMAIAGLVP